MRPVVKSSCPQDDFGRDIIFKKFQNARGELIDRLGQYCSYCEMKLDSALAVEHIQPIHPEGVSADMQERKVCWDNFLLACPNCNGTKNNIDVIPDDYLWPHKDNTFLALTYSEGGVIRVSANLSDALKTKAHNTIRLTGLDKSPTTNPKLSNDPARSDRRWENRREVWNIACDAKADLTGHDTPELRKSIITAALGHAYWSIWMTVFKDDADMCRRLIDAFVGTCRECFDEQQGFAPMPRLGGQI